jgi:hypothetical protein
VCERVGREAGIGHKMSWAGRTAGPADQGAVAGGGAQGRSAWKLDLWITVATLCS